MWWEHHAADILDLKHHLYAPRITSSSPLLWGGRQPSRKDAERPIRRTVQTVVIPTLRIALDNPNLHREIRYAVVVALGRLGAIEHAETVRDIVSGRRPFHGGAEAALFSLALLRVEPGHPDSNRMDWWIRGFAKDPNLKPRLRSLAASLGAAPRIAAPTLESPDGVRARFLLTAARQLDTRWLPLTIAWLDDPRAPPLTLRAAALAAGSLAPEAPPSLRRSIVDRLRAVVRDESADLELRVLCCFALGDIATPDARLDLVDFARTQPLPIQLAALFAAHGVRDQLTRVHRAALRRVVRGLDGPADYAAMIRLCRGLYRDTTAIEELLRQAPTRGDASTALGLLGNASTRIVETLGNAVDRTTDPTIRRNAACALVMLRAPELDARLVKRFEAALTFQHQASWIDTIGRVGSHASVPALIDILFDERRPVALRAAAVQALGRMGDLRPRSPFTNASHLFIPGLEEPRISSWLAQR